MTTLVWFLIPILLVALAVLLIRKASDRGAGDGAGVRRFFQYLLAYGLLVLTAVGLATLLTRLFPASPLVDRSTAELARGLAFTLVGGPLYYGVAMWSWRHLRRSPTEARSLGWAIYITAAALTALFVTMVSLYSVLIWAVGVADFDPGALSRLIVWGVVWGGHYYLDGRLTPPDRARFHRLAGALAGLVTAATGLGGAIAAALEMVWGLAGELVVGEGLVWRPIITLVVGGLTWWFYWVRSAARMEPSPLQVGYVLLVGVVGGLIAVLSSSATILYDVLVWFLGDPGATPADRHFAGVTAAIGGVTTGGLVWWYHRAILEAVGTDRQAEAKRVYLYLLAGVGLVAAAGGLTAILVAFIETVTASPGDVGGGAVNTLLGAVTLLLVGAPTWAVYWRRAQGAAAAHPEEERASPTRRFYLFVLFGVGGVVATIALLVAVYMFFESIVEARFGVETIRSARFAVATLLTTGAIAGYHWAVYRGERHSAPARRYPERVVLVGPVTTSIATELARRTHSRVEAWQTEGEPWQLEDLIGILEGESGSVVVTAAGDGLRAVAVNRV